MKLIDLRSDTVTLPTPEMMEAIMKAKLGDDGRARGDKGEDETAVAVEKKVADKLGLDDSLFVPSGTFGNTVCVMAYAKRGDSVVVASNSHIYKSEKVLFDDDVCGRVPVIVPQIRGVYNIAELISVLRTKKIAVVCIENSYNFEGGAVIPKNKMREIIDLCSSYGVPVHLDGARIFNAAEALNTDVANLIKGVKSVMVCVSKGLCAPIGSFIAGDKEFIKKVRDIRKKMGGQLRQVGILEAAAGIAIDTMTNYVNYDNIRARKLAEGIQNAKGIYIDMSTVQTNIIKVDLTGRVEAREFIKRLEDEKKVKTHYINDSSIRLVTYHGISDDDIEETITRIKDFCNSI